LNCKRMECGFRGPTSAKKSQAIGCSGTARGSSALFFARMKSARKERSSSRGVEAEDRPRQSARGCVGENANRNRLRPHVSSVTSAENQRSDRLARADAAN